MTHRYPAWLALAATLVFASGAPAVAFAQTTPDVMDLGVTGRGHAKVRLTVTAGPSGAPNGFEVCYMPAALFTTTYGGVWPPPWGAGEGWVDFTGTGTIHTWGSASVDFKLAPNQSLDIEIGDTYDESGVSGTASGQLPDGTDFVFCAYAIGGGGGSAGALSVTCHQGTSHEGEHCTFTVGYWKNHPGAWPVSSLALGSVTYSAAQLMQILNQPSAGNGLITLARQLIAAKLNIAAGSDPTSIASTIASADVLIGSKVVPPIGAGFLSPGSVSHLTEDLDDYNNSEDDHDHCGHGTPAHGTTWGQLKTVYR